MGEALSLFKKGHDISFGGVLLSLPFLLSNGLLKHTQKYFRLPAGFYSIIHIFLSLSFLVLLRIKTIESAKRINPGELGKLIGLDRIPEIRTLREKLGILADQNKSHDWGMALFRDWFGGDESVKGLLYVDGHVRVYHGKQTKLPKRYVAREKLCLRGMTDYWINDNLGRPFFVVTSAFNKGMLSALRSEIIPQLLKEIPSQFSEEELKLDPLKSRFSIIFDREGYSPDFFKEMWENYRISCYTYNKYPKADWDEGEFKEMTLKYPNGEEAKAKLSEKRSLIGKKIWMREIRKLTESQHQTSLISTDFASSTEDLCVNMFSRWSQENFFKYMRENFGIDKLIEYSTTPINDTMEVVNPQYRKFESEVRSICQKLYRKIAQFGAMVLDEKKGEEYIKTYTEKKAELKESIEFYQKKLDEMKGKRKETKKHIKISELPENEQFTSLDSEKKHIMDNIKMIAYRAETAMANQIKKFMAKPKEARTVIQQILNTEVDLEPDKENKKLMVSLHCLANEKTNKIAKYLCEKLNETKTVFPGTNLTIYYKLVSYKNPRDQVI